MNAIWIAPTGWDNGDLTLSAIEKFQTVSCIILKTVKLPCAQWLRASGIDFESLDTLFDSTDDFDALNSAVVSRLIDLAQEREIIYAVAHSTDRTVKMLTEMAVGEIHILPGVSYEGKLLAYADTHYTVAAASDMDAFIPQPGVNTIITEIDDRYLASEVKISLLDHYPDELQIIVLDGGNVPQYVSLTDLDRLDHYDHRTCVLIPAVHDVNRLTRYDFGHLNRIMRTLRGPGGCPWDREQTHDSLVSNVVEEAYEVVDAIHSGDVSSLYDELGDLLLQVALHAEIARQHGEFDIYDVTTAICGKLIKRHPHIFGDVKAETSDEVYELWQNIKKREKQVDTQYDTLKAVSKSLPALMRARKVLDRAKDVGFMLETDDLTGDIEKMTACDDAEKLELMYGDIMMKLTAHARGKVKSQPEQMLMSSIDRFIEAFGAMEKSFAVSGKQLNEITDMEFRAYWRKHC